MSAGAVLVAAVEAALAGVEGLSGVFDGEPVRGGDAHAVIEMGPQTDWSHKSGEGRELRLAVSVRVAGERPDRVRVLMDGIEAAMQSVGPDLDGWRLASLIWLRGRKIRETKRAPGPGWVGIADYRARMMRAP